MQSTWPARDLVAVGDLDREHRALHRADDRVLAAPPAPPPRRRSRRARASAAQGGSGSSSRDLEAPAVDLDEPGAPRPATVRRPSCRLPLSHATTARASSASCSDSTTPAHVSPATKHGCASSARWKPSSVVTPSISNSSSARSIRLRACSRSSPWTISFAIIGS